MVERPGGTLDEAGDAVESTLSTEGWRLLARVDAGKWAFMRNMGIPGSIHDELAAQIKSGLGLP